MRYRALELMRMRPPLWCGGHSFVLLDEQVEWCTGCYQGVPIWAVREGLWAPIIGRWCPRLMRALGGPT